MRRLRDLGEHAWIAALTRRLARRGPTPGVLVGPGDDAAVVRSGRHPLVLTTDTLVEGVHFRRSWLTPNALGRRAFAVNASDVAAMGGVPRLALLALEAPPRLPVRELDALVAGFASLARRHGVALVGGNLSRGPHLAITVFLLGEAPSRPVIRGGGRPGDALVVTGRLGVGGLAVRALRAGHKGRLPVPPVRLAVSRRLAPLAHAMIDVSDGLVQDAGHLCRASGLGAEIMADRLPVAPACRRALGRRAPRFAATAGEDYELLAALAPERVAEAVRRGRAVGCRVTSIGRLVAGRPAVRLLDAKGRPLAIADAGFDHFH